MEQISIKRAFVKYVSLNVIGMVGLSCYILADTFFVARGVGADGLTALNLAIPIYSFIHGIGLMIGIGGSTRFAISKSKVIFTQSVFYGIFAACLLAPAGLLLSNQLAVMLGADGDTLQNTTIYLRTILYFAPMFLLNNVVLCFVRNDGNPKLSMAAMLVGSFANIILDYVFVFPCKMGMFGAALATGIAPIVSLIILSTHFATKAHTLKLVKCKLQRNSIADISFLGFSAFITELSSGAVMIVFNMIILRLEGNTGVAAYGIVANIALVAIAVFTGVAQGMQPIVSRFYGMNNHKAAKKILKYGFLTAASFAIAIYAMSAMLADPIVAAFNKDANAQLAEIAANGIRLYFTAFVFIGLNILCASYYSATDKPAKAFVISLLRGFVVIIPTAFALAALFGINGVWMALTLTELLVFLVCIGMLKKRGPSNAAG